jgi:DNA-binding transcriptional regulator YiaG
MQPYHYTACGLDNVLLEGIQMVADDDNQSVLTVRRVAQLHRAIAQAVVQKPSALNGKELRFLRSEMDMTQAELAAILRREPLTISRWERSENPIEENADALIRLLAEEKLDLGLGLTVEQVTSWTLDRAHTRPFRIDGSDPKNYRPVLEAA